MPEEKEIYRLTDWSYDRLKAMIDKFNRKAIKLGFPEVQIAEVGREMEKDLKATRRLWEKMTASGIPFKPDEVEPVMREVNLLSIDYPHEVKIKGWQFAAKIEPQVESDKNMVLHVPGFDEDLPEKYREATMECDHCRANRFRKAVFVLRSEDQWKQVGSTCLRDFLGHGSPEGILSYLQSLQDLSKQMIECGDWDDSDDTFHSGWIDTIVYLSHVWAVAEAKGFVTKSRAEVEMRQATADQAFDNIYLGQMERVAVNQDDRDEAAKMVEWAQEMLAAKVQEGGATDYEWTLLTILEKEFFHLKYSGFVASIYLLYKRKLEQDSKQGDFLWSEGDKVEFTAAVLSVVPYPTQYGVSYVTKFDVGGKVAIAFISYCKLEEGREYTFQDVVVEEHSFFNSIAQTKVKISFRKKVNKDAVERWKADEDR